MTRLQCTPFPDLVAGDLAVLIVPRGDAQFVGTRAQLEQEGLVPPAGTTWPAQPGEVRAWQADGFAFELTYLIRGPLVLRRVRIADLHCAAANARLHARRTELAKVAFGDSHAGRLQLKQHREALQDADFQRVLRWCVGERAGGSSWA